jgi:hypothetical protein
LPQALPRTDGGQDTSTGTIPRLARRLRLEPRRRVKRKR